MDGTRFRSIFAGGHYFPKNSRRELRQLRPALVRQNAGQSRTAATFKQLGWIFLLRLGLIAIASTFDGDVGRLTRRQMSFLAGALGAAFQAPESAVGGVAVRCSIFALFQGQSRMNGESEAMHVWNLKKGTVFHLEI